HCLLALDDEASLLTAGPFLQETIVLLEDAVVVLVGGQRLDPFQENLIVAALLVAALLDIGDSAVVALPVRHQGMMFRAGPALAEDPRLLLALSRLVLSLVLLAEAVQG